MATIEQFNEWERQFAMANGCDMARTLRGSVSFPTDDTFSVEVIELDEEGRPHMEGGELVRTTVTQQIAVHVPQPWEPTK